jgi:hypothetical protein
MINMKKYILQPTMTHSKLPATAPADKPAAAATRSTLPPRQPLSTATVDASRSALKLGLDVHLEFIMVVVQRNHGSTWLSSDERIGQAQR